MIRRFSSPGNADTSLNVISGAVVSSGFMLLPVSCIEGHCPMHCLKSARVPSRREMRDLLVIFFLLFFFDVCPVVRLIGHQVAWTGWRCGCPQRVHTAQSQGRIQATHFRGAQPVLDRLNVLLPRRRLLRQSSPPGGPQGGAKIVSYYRAC